jgi:hypothetical protein
LSIIQYSKTKKILGHYPETIVLKDFPSIVSALPKLFNMPVRHFAGTRYIFISITRYSNSKENNNWRIFSTHVLVFGAVENCYRNCFFNEESDPYS